MDALHPADRLEALGRDECLRLLAAQDVGRVGFVADGQPRVEPVNYRLIDGDVVIASRPGAKLEAALLNSRVAFEIDAVEEWARAGWSVMVSGTMSLIEDANERAVIAARAPQAWAPTHGLSLIKITVDQMSGRRVRVGPGEVSVVVQAPEQPRPED
jgi:nitroimidazol reductase NimA-like FMN-containing flavoprotein (pyridoxamine 5'-phosphate oxidase superfamily)